MRMSRFSSVLLLCVAVVFVSLIFLSQTVSAQPVPYLGLFIDETHSLHYVMLSTPLVPFEVFSWVYPSENGMVCAEFDIVYPEYLVMSGHTDNPEALIPIVPDPDGVTVCFGECRTDWVWLRSFNFLPTSTGGMDFIRIVPHPISGVVQAATCHEGNPYETFVLMNYFCINDPACPIANESASWGAIKTMYED
ncbi:MAG: hypothetical protein KOO63_01670 [Bacteroidales bacterium]|nr:hypothetical protein [Candidatus Latescibacterota bacterium]